MKTETLEITAEERGLLLRTLKWIMEKQLELPFESVPYDYWLCNRLRQKLNPHEREDIHS